MPVPREERLAQIRPLLEQGMTTKHIALRLGVSAKTVRGILSDPDGSKARALKRSYRGTCLDCGGPTDGSNGPGKAPLRCIYCTTSKKRPPDTRRRIPVKLTEIEFARRIEAAHEACRVERGDWERQLILLAAIDPSDNVYWVAA
jgi:hypothetical protein